MVQVNMSSAGPALAPGSRRGQRSGRWLVMAAGAVVAAVGLGFLGLGYQGAIDRNLVPEGTSPDQVEAVLKAMPAADLAAMADRQRALLHEAPLDIQAIKTLAALAQVAGDSDRAKALTIIAGDRNLRDTPTQQVILKLLMADKNYDGALYRLDGLMRAGRMKADELLPALAAFAGEGNMRTALVNLLKTNPPWRDQLIHYLVGGSFDVATAYALIAALDDANSPVTSSQLAMLLQNLAKQRDYDKAYFIWLDSLSEAELRQARLVFDGDFNNDLKNRLFDWTFRRTDNVELRLTPRAAGSVDRVVRIDFAPGRTAFNNFYQYLRLAPGVYVLSLEAKTEELSSDSGLIWRMRCADDGNLKVIGESQPLRGDTAWQVTEHSFTVPDSGCATQLLRLELARMSVLDQQISGRAFYDNIKITRREDGTAPEAAADTEMAPQDNRAAPAPGQ